MSLKLAGRCRSVELVATRVARVPLDTKSLRVFPLPPRAPPDNLLAQPNQRQRTRRAQAVAVRISEHRHLCVTVRVRLVSVLDARTHIGLGWAAGCCTGWLHWLAGASNVSCRCRGVGSLVSCLSSQAKPTSIAGRSSSTSTSTRAGGACAMPRPGCNLFDFPFALVLLIKPPARHRNAKSLAATPPPLPLCFQTAPPFPPSRPSAPLAHAPQPSSQMIHSCPPVMGDISATGFPLSSFLGHNKHSSRRSISPCHPWSATYIICNPLFHHHHHPIAIILLGHLACSHPRTTNKPPHASAAINSLEAEPTPIVYRAGFYQTHQTLKTHLNPRFGPS